MSTKNIKKDLKTFSDRDIEILYKYYKVNNMDDLISKIYAFQVKNFLPSGIIEAIEKQDFEEYKKISDSIANPEADENDLNDPDEAYEIFLKVEKSNLDPDTKLTWIEYLFNSSWPPAEHKISLNGNKIKINPEMNLNIITNLRIRGSPRHLTINEFQTIFNRLLDRLNYQNEKYEMLDLIVRYASKMWGGIVKDPVQDIKKLINRYPDINLYKHFKWYHDQEETVFELALRYDDKRVIQYLIDNAPDKTSLAEPELLFITSDIDTITMLISIGVNVNAVQHGEPYLVYIINDTGMHYNVKIKEIIKLLYNTGKLDLEKENNKGETALYVAASHSPKVFSYLIELGADINHQTHSGITVLMKTAAFSQHKDQNENFKTLMKYKDRLDFNLQSKNSNSTALLACQDHNTFINPRPSFDAEIELIRYTNLDVQNKGGNTILHLAFDKRIVLECLLRGANPNIINNKGEAPLNINIQGFKNTYSSRTKESHEIYNQNIINLLKYNSNLDNIEIQDLLLFYDLVIPNLEHKLNTLLLLLNKPEKKLFEEKCSKQIYFKKETKEVEHIKYLQKCIKTIEEMVKYKPGGEEERALVKKYKDHPQFNKF